MRSTVVVVGEKHTQWIADRNKTKADERIVKGTHPDNPLFSPRLGCSSRPSMMPFGWSPGSDNGTGTSSDRTSSGTGAANSDGVCGEWSAAGQRVDITSYNRPCVPRTRHVMYLKSVDNPI